jgi:hypothetical protein
MAHLTRHADEEVVDEHSILQTPHPVPQYLYPRRIKQNTCIESYSLKASAAKSIQKVNYLTRSFEVFTAVNMKNGVFFHVMPGGSCKNLRFGGT